MDSGQVDHKLLRWSSRSSALCSLSIVGSSRSSAATQRAMSC